MFNGVHWVKSMGLNQWVGSEQHATYISVNHVIISIIYTIVIVLLLYTLQCPPKKGNIMFRTAVQENTTEHLKALFKLTNLPCYIYCWFSSWKSHPSSETIYSLWNDMQAVRWPSPSVCSPSLAYLFISNFMDRASSRIDASVPAPHHLQLLQNPPPK